MQNEIEVIFGESNRWLQPEYTTYVNPGNTFSKVYPTNMYDPIMYDYIFRKVNSPEKVSVCTSLFKLPMLKTKLKRSQLLKHLIAYVFQYNIGIDNSESAPLSPINSF